MNSMALGMEQFNIPTEIYLGSPPRCLGCIHLANIPQPGSQVEVEGQQYTVLERRHRYQLRMSRYQLHHIALYVQPRVAGDVNLAGSIGDANCQYNAHSALLRCAINPDGPCQDCVSFIPTRVRSAF